jgi:inosine/xanthosine triphosphatase
MPRLVVIWPSQFGHVRVVSRAPTYVTDNRIAQTTMLAYLCGPIEFADGGGRQWRREMAHFLIENLGHRVYDPAEDETKNLTQEEVANFRGWKLTDAGRHRAAIRKIIHFDLDIVAGAADYLICYWSQAAPLSAGTAAEMTAAFRKGIPVYLVTPLPPQQLSGWMLGCADEVFATIEDLKKFLLERYSSAESKGAAISPPSPASPRTLAAVAVGSMRKPKVLAAEQAFRSYGSTGGYDFEVVGFEVPSGVAATPLSAAEMRLGARQRAEALREITRSSPKPWKFFVGLEGGLDVTADAGRRLVFLQSWAYVLDTAGRGYYGQSAGIAVPDTLAGLVIDAGIELSEAVDAFAGGQGIRDNQGVWGVLTGGAVTRQDAFRAALSNALRPFRHGMLYAATGAAASGGSDSSA